MYCLRAIDIETTGFRHGAVWSDGLAHLREPVKDNRICEIGWCDIYEYVGVMRPEYALINPGIPIPKEASDVHHIEDKHVKNAPSLTEFFSDCYFDHGVDVFVAHNAKFERDFLRDTPLVKKPWICTYYVLDYWRRMPGGPDLVNCQGSTVHKFLGLGHDPLANPQHRAGPDAYMSAQLLVKVLWPRFTVEQMVEMTQQYPYPVR